MAVAESLKDAEIPLFLVKLSLRTCVLHIPGASLFDRLDPLRLPGLDLCLAHLEVETHNCIIFNRLGATLHEHTRIPSESDPP